ncbi:hypothetical protein [Natronorubrum aibiense]|uniref:PRC-barrel domain containing protein n=1 Tax=Natronorubrum aibiense TaxID=348826 RepID=A0A5P9P0F7_9EURY|nr:hypothetical protein [Natronorubrum aibiense]QFU81615.1 hypothetical protein GCU68_03085 [Natronorubrum aibiense]
MCASFTADDVGKPVVNAAGEEIGVVTTVERGVARVRPASDAVESITSSIGWDGVVAAAHPLDPDAVRELTDEAVRLEGTLSDIDESTTRGLAGEPTEL